jgi:hypothetical protein
VAARYARALFAAASSQKIVEPVRKELARLRDTLAASPALDDALRHPRVGPEAKQKVIEKVFGRFRANNQTISGVYGGVVDGQESWEAIKADIAKFAEEEGRRPRIMIAKLGQDGHDRGAKVVATAFADLGFDVDVGPLFQTPGEAARQAVENEANAIAIANKRHSPTVDDVRKAADAVMLKKVRYDEPGRNTTDFVESILTSEQRKTAFIPIERIPAGSIQAIRERSPDRYLSDDDVMRIYYLATKGDDAGIDSILKNASAKKDEFRRTFVPIIPGIN